MSKTSGRYVAVLWSLALIVVVVDQLTKAWAVSALADSRRISLLGHWLGFVLVRNPGAAFSFATGWTWVFTAVAVVVTVVVLRVSRRLGSMWWATTLGLVLGGSVGNLIDRLIRNPGVFRGYVVDFIDYGGFFVGNIADVAIVGAALAIMALSLVGVELDGRRTGDRHEDGRPDTASSGRESGAGGGGDAAGTAPGPVEPAESLRQPVERMPVLRAVHESEGDPPAVDDPVRGEGHRDAGVARP